MFASLLIIALAASPATEIHVSGQSEAVVERTASHTTSYRRLPGTDEFIQEMVVPVDAPTSQPVSPPDRHAPTRHQQSLIGCW